MKFFSEVVSLDILYRDPSCAVALCLDVTYLYQSIPLWEGNTASQLPYPTDQRRSAVAYC